MKNIITLLFLFFYLSSFSNENHQHNHNPEHEVEHLSMYDTFFGSNELHQVCYSTDHRKFFYIIFLLMLITVVLLLVIIFFKVRYNNTLKKQKYLVTKKNKEMTDSIQYALGIQKTILPEKEEFNKLFPNSLVFYQPKDIVSGDFYYCTEVNNIRYLAVIDCTGHGVPGAFLTLIGNQALNRTIHDDYIYQPNEILSQMNQYVKKSLKQMDCTSIQDGMEIGLIKIDKKNNSIEFSGAGLNLLLSNESGIERVKGSRLTVGSRESHVKQGPENKVFDLAKYQKAFLYSDGVIDQFGEKNEKFKTRRLVSFLANNKDETISVIKDRFINTFNNWRGSKDQVDDITFIGVEL